MYSSLASGERRHLDPGQVRGTGPIATGLRINRMEKDTLYYDGACPLCRAEIGKLERHSRENLCLVDIHQMDGDESVPDRETLLARLHLRTGDGQWLTGLDANIRAWHHTPFRGLWRVLGWPLVRPFSNAAYELWLRWRARRN